MTAILLILFFTDADPPAATTARADRSAPQAVQLDIGYLRPGLDWYFEIHVTAAGDHLITTVGNLDLKMDLHELDKKGTWKHVATDDDTGRRLNPAIHRHLTKGRWRVRLYPFGTFRYHSEVRYLVLRLNKP